MNQSAISEADRFHCIKPENIDVIVFDLGNVLVQLRSAAAMWPGLDPDGDEVRQRDMNWGKHPAIRGYETGTIRGLERVYQRMRRDDPELISREGFLTAFNSVIGSLYPETISLLDRLRPQYRLIILSNTSPAHWQMVEARDHLSQRVERCLLSYEIGCLKPEPRCYQILIEQCDCRADKILYFDDRPENIRQAINYGINSYQTYGGNELKQLAKNLRLF